MSMLYTTIQNLQLPFLAQGAAQEIVTIAETMQFLPFKDIAPSITHRYNRELTLGVSSSFNPIAPNGTWSESAPTYTQVEDVVAIYADSAYVPKVSLNDPNVIASAVAAKAKVVARSWERAFITGSGTYPQPTGLRAAVSGTTREEAVATAGSGSLTLAKMDTLLSKVDAGKPSFIVMNTTQKNALIGLVRAAGALPNFITSPNLGAGQYLTYNGVPVLVNDNITQADNNAGSRVYAVYASSLDGVTGFFNASNVIEVSDPIAVNQSDMVEIQVVARLGLSQMSSHAVYCLYGVI